MGKDHKEPDYGCSEEVASQTIDGLKFGEIAYVFTRRQLECVMKKSCVPFFYTPLGSESSGGITGYLLNPAMFEVVDMDDTTTNSTLCSDYYLRAKRFYHNALAMGKNVGFRIQDNYYGDAYYIYCEGATCDEDECE